MRGIPVFAAIIVGLFSSFVQSLGLTIQRKSHIQEESVPPHSRRRPIRRPLWLLGFGVYITSNIFSTIFQLDALPIVILAPLGAVSLIFNALLARLMLGDRFGPTWIGGTALVAVGAVLIAVFGVVPEEEHGLDELLTLFRRGAFVGFFSVMSVATAMVLLAAHTASWHVQRQLSRIQLPADSTSGRSTPVSVVPSNYASPHPTSPPIPFRSTRPSKRNIPIHVQIETQRHQSRRWSSPTSPQDPTVPLPNSKPSDTTPSSLLTQQAQTEDAFKPIDQSDQLHLDLPLITKFATPNQAQQRTLTSCGLAFAAASGTLSGMCLVLAKAAVELLVITLDHFRTGKGQNEFARVQTWFLAGGLGVCAILQLVYLNYSLTFASPALICPLAFCFFNLSSIFDGLVFYDQFGQLSTYQIVLVSVGVGVLLLGVWVVSAVQSDAGVDVGTWVEDEDEDEDSVLLPHGHGDRLETEEGVGLLDTAVDGSRQRSEPDPFSPQHGQTPDLVQSYPQPSPRQGTPEVLYRSVFSTPGSPTSPLSPRFPHSHGGGGRRYHRTRYGSLLPDFPAGPVAPTGFSIGLGASSPGFALRSGSISGDGHFHPHHGDGTHSHLNAHHGPVSHLTSGSRGGFGLSKKGRSHSEGPIGISAIMRGDDPASYEARTEDPDPESHTQINAQSQVRFQSPEGVPRANLENQAEASLRDWDALDSSRTTGQSGNGRNLWGRIFGAGSGLGLGLGLGRDRGRIRLEDVEGDEHRDQDQNQDGDSQDRHQTQNGGANRRHR